MDTLTHPSHFAQALKVLHILAPASVMLAYVIASLAHIFKTSKAISVQADENARKRLRFSCITLIILVMTTYIAESILLACTLPRQSAASPDDLLPFTLFSGLVWLIMLLRLVEVSVGTERSIFLPAWAVALVFEIPFLVLGIVAPALPGKALVAQILWQALRVALLLILVGITLGRYIIVRHEKANDEEVAPLLAQVRSHLSSSDAHGTNGDAYGTTTAEDAGKKPDATDSTQVQASKNDETDDEDEDEAETGKFAKDWWVYTQAFGVFIPHLWPRDNPRLLLHFPALVLCLLASRGLNVLVPLQLGLIVNTLQSSTGNVPWIQIAVFILLSFLTSSAGVNLVQTLLWMPIDQYATVQLITTAYNHVMNMSSDFHDSKQSGRIWRIVARGESLTNLVHTVAFEMFPMAADLAIAISVLWWLFDAYMAFVVALSSVLFLWSTAKAIPMKTKRQREVINAWEDEDTQMTESSLNWMTVSYFNRIGYEQDRFKNAVRHRQGQFIRYRIFSHLVSALRGLTLLTGLMVAALLAAYQISEGKRDVGAFVVLITYWGQLTGPLSYFANGFPKIAKSLVDAEKLLGLLKTSPSVQNAEDAAEFVLKQGQVDFDRVCFSYDGKRQVADNISFRAEPGQTVALVGETGGGKSTILKLLFRFYDVTGGSVVIDGQDVRHVTLESLRAHIGCVPQDPALFNKTIWENLRYARLDATDEEIQEACKAVALHDKILSFTKGYSEKVGEQGVKLSGGELQRMAIARAILMDPKILLLDEATSSVDSETEALIQSSLKKLCAGRTTFVIAHRLSTIIHANLVIVINDGRILERGTHDKLMRLGGHYSQLWTRQLTLQTADANLSTTAHAREKSALLDNVGDEHVESHRRLPETQSHESRCSGDDGGLSGENGREKAVDPSLDDTSRGRPARRGKTLRGYGEYLGSVIRRASGSKAARSKNKNDTDQRRSWSSSQRHTTLKPNAPEFVPRNPSGIVRGLAETSPSSNDHGQDGSDNRHPCTDTGLEAVKADRDHNPAAKSGHDSTELDEPSQEHSLEQKKPVDQAVTSMHDSSVQGEAFGSETDAPYDGSCAEAQARENADGEERR